MNKITITIPEEFKQEYYKDKLKETFDRVIVDLEYNIDQYGYGLAGNHELETLKMLRKEFANSALQEEENG